MADNSPKGWTRRSQRLARIGSEAERKTDPMVRLGELITRLPNGCWRFGKHLNSYSWFYEEGFGRVPTHRRVYETLVGPIPEGHILHHECENPGCVNPQHLLPLTQAEHMARHREMRKD